MSNSKYQAIKSAKYILRLAGYNTDDAVYAGLVRERAKLDRELQEAHNLLDKYFPYEDEASYDESMQYEDEDVCTECGGDMRGHQWPYCECVPYIQHEQPEDSIKEESYPDIPSHLFKGRDIDGNEGFFEDFEQSIGEA